MTEAKKMLITQRNRSGKLFFNILSADAEDSFAFAEQDNTFVARLAERLRMLSDESRINAMLEILAILNQFTRTEDTP